MTSTPLFAFCLRSQEGNGLPDNTVYVRKCFAVKFKFIDVITKWKFGARIRNTSKNTGDAVLVRALTTVATVRTEISAG
jgi:hypothetical protein